MKHIIVIILACFSFSLFAQNNEEQELLALKKANDLVFEGNILVDNDDHISAEMEYRKAISEQPNYTVGTYNLGNSYYKKGNFEEALYRLKQTARHATTKEEKHKAFHNIGNILMQDKQCKEAAEAFKNALRQNPKDDETRYNYALAKECAKEQEQQDQQDENKEQNEDKKEDQKEQEKEQEDQNKEDQPEDEGENDKKDGEDKEDEEGKPEDEKNDQGKNEENKKEKPKPQPGQLSPQQVKNLLEAMNDQEQKVQDKMNAQKQKGSKVQTEKDW